MRDDYQNASYSDFQTVANAFTQGLRELPNDYVTRVRNFLAEYLGSSNHPVPFGGRAKEFTRLDAWLADTQADPYLLLAAPAGRGKSALLLRWCQRLFARSNLAVAYFPVSIRFRTNLAGVVFPSLVALLARLHEEKVPTDPNMQEEVWRGLLMDYMNRPLADGRTLVLVIDGVDEAADWSAGSGLFPLDPPAGLRIVLSARSLANDQSADAWLQRLNWTKPGLAHTLELYPLDRSGIASVLTQMGFPLDRLSTRINIVSELYRLSEGDPLLVRLYIDDLWARGEAVMRLQPEDLRAMHPGLAGYFERWWQDQRSLWNQEAPQREAMTQMVLNLLAAALGPLSQADILNLLPAEEDFNAENLRQHLAPLARFVTGDGIHQGYVFSHPRLGNYFLEERMSATEREEVEQRFLTWGAQTLAALNTEQITPEQASPYCVQYYGAHLERAQATASVLLTLVTQGWLRAWEKLDRANAGFLSDVERAWRAVERENQTTIDAGTPAPYMGEEIRCLLCQVSINSVTSNISPRLMLEAVKTGVWTPAQGLACIRLIGDLAPRARELAELAPYVQEPLRTDILQEALDTIATIKDTYTRLDALVELAPALPQDLLWQILEIIPAIEDEADRAGILTELAPALTPYPPTVYRALEYVQNMEDEEYQALALEGLAASFTESQIEQVWQQLETIADERYQAQILTALVPFLTENRLQEAWQMTHTMQDGLSRIRLLTELIIALPEPAQREALQEALELLREIEDREYRVEVFVKLASFLAEETIHQALSEIQHLWDESARANALISLLPHLPETQLSEFQESVLALKSDEQCARVLTPLIPFLSEELMDKALKRVQTTWDEGCRVELLAQFAQFAPSSLLPRLLEIITSIRDQGYRVWLLAELEVPLLGKLNGAQFNVAAVFQGMKGREDRLQTLLAIAPRLSESALLKIFNFMLPEIFDFTWRIQSDEERAHILTKLGPRLPEGWLARTLIAIRAINNEIFQVQALIALAPRIQGQWLTQALDIIRGMKDRERRAEVLEALVSSLPEERRGERVQEMLQVLQVIKDEAARVQAASGYASALTSKLSLERVHVVLQAIREMQQEKHKAQILTTIAPHLPEQAFEEVLDITQNFKFAHAEEQSPILEALAPHIPPYLFSNFLEQIFTIQEPRWRTHLLTASLSYAPEEIIRELLAEAQEMQIPQQRAEMLAVLAPYAPQEFFAQMWDLMKTFPDEGLYVRTLGVLALRLPESFFPQLWETILAIPNALWQAWILKTLTPHMSENLFAQALAATLAIEDPEKRASFVSVLAPHVPERFFLPLWENTQTFAIEARWRNLELLAARVPEPCLAPFLAEVQAISEGWMQIQILEALIPHATEDSFFQLWNAAQTIQHRPTRLHLLEKLASRVPPHLSLLALQRIQELNISTLELMNLLKILLPLLIQAYPTETLEILPTLPQLRTKPEILAVLVPYLTPEMAVAILDMLFPIQPGEDPAETITAEKIQSNKSLLYLLAELAPRLPSEKSSLIVSLLLQILAELKRPEERELLLSKMAPYLPSALLPTLLEATWSLAIPMLQTRILKAFLPSISPTDYRTMLDWIRTKVYETGETQFSMQVLSLVSSLKDQPSPPSLYPLLHDTLHHLTQQTRREALAEIAYLAPALLAIGGENAVIEAYSANLEIGCWWP